MVPKVPSRPGIIFSQHLRLCYSAPAWAEWRVESSHSPGFRDEGNDDSGGRMVAMLEPHPNSTPAPCM